MLGAMLQREETGISETDERIVDAFLHHYQARARFDADAARATLVKIYPALVGRLEIVLRNGRRMLVKHPARRV